jgi:hypothetical protein
MRSLRIYNDPSSESLNISRVRRNSGFNLDDVLHNKIEYSFKIDTFEDEIEFLKNNITLQVKEEAEEEDEILNALDHSALNNIGNEEIKLDTSLILPSIGNKRAS